MTLNPAKATLESNLIEIYETFLSLLQNTEKYLTTDELNSAYNEYITSYSHEH